MSRKPRSTRRIISYSIISVMVVIALGIIFAPWERIATWQIRKQLNAMGLQEVEFAIEDISITGVQLNHVRYMGYELEHVVVAYSFQDIIKGRFDQLYIDDLSLDFSPLTLQLAEVNTIWKMDEHGPGRSAKWKIGRLAINGAPVDIGALNGEGEISVLPKEILAKGRLQGEQGHDIRFMVDYPLEASSTATVTLPEAVLEIQGHSELKAATLRFNTEAIKSGQVEALDIGSVDFQKDAMHFTANGIHAKLRPASDPVEQIDVLNIASLAYDQGKTHVSFSDLKSNWIASDKPNVRPKADWSLTNLKMEPMPLEVPILNASGDVRLEADAYKGNAYLADSSRTHKVAFAYKVPKATPLDTSLYVTQLRYPWNEGVVSIAPTTLTPFNGGATDITLLLEKVPLEKLLGLALGDKATATGLVTGRIPVRIGADGTLEFDKGTLSAGNQGIISLSDEAIPGSQAQVEVVRNVMKNFHYNTLSIDVTGGENKKQPLSLLLSLRGHNPDVYDGRAVHLNVKLNGDVLSLLTQSMTIFKNPQSLLSRE